MAARLWRWIDASIIGLSPAMASRGLGAHLAWAAAERADRGTGGLVGAPLEVHFEASASAPSLHVPPRPGFGEGGEEADLAGVALEEQLRDPRRAAEVAVALSSVIDRISSLLSFTVTITAFVRG